MLSKALRTWREQRSQALNEIEAAHRAIGGTSPGGRYATLRVNHAYAVLLASSFQAFCRDLHSEAVDHLVSLVPAGPAKFFFQRQMTHGRQLDFGNAHPGALGADFGRLLIDPRGFWPAVLGSPRVPAIVQRKRRLEELIVWRNAIAHQDWTHVGHDDNLRLERVRRWRSTCNMLASRFDRVVRVELYASTGKAPW